MRPTIAWQAADRSCLVRDQVALDLARQATVECVVLIDVGAESDAGIKGRNERFGKRVCLGGVVAAYLLEIVRCGASS